MSRQDINTRKPSAAARAEAAAWVARLHSANRTREVEAGLRRWLRDDPEHAVAFELLTDTWENATRLRRCPAEAEQVARCGRVGFRITLSRAVLATLATAILAVIGAVLYPRNDVVATGVGELRTVTLEDGSRVHLNAVTKLVVKYDKHVRRVRLERGEAFFEVAKRPDWPFVVMAGAHQITDIGTEFDVRREVQGVALTLVEGKVIVTPAGWGVVSSRTNSLSGQEQTSLLKAAASRAAATYVLSPGERLTFFAGSGSPRMDRPRLEQVIAWEHEQVVLDNTSLADAVAQMNQYSHRQIVIDSPAAAAIRVSGIFEAGASEDFARAVAKIYHLRVIDQSSQSILLTSKDSHSDP